MTALSEPRTRQVADSIHRAIILGELRPGQRLREVALAAEFGVSRPTMREALLQLVQDGLCEQQHNRGFSVTQLDDSAIRDLAETRLVLDRMAIEGIWVEPTRINEVEGAWAEYADAGADPVQQHTAHLRLHQAIWSASHNAMLARLWPVAQSWSTLVLAQDQAVRRDPQRAHDVHARLMDAIRSRDHGVLEEALSDHTRRSAEELLALRGEG